MLGSIAEVSLRRITKYLDADELEEEKDELVGSYNSHEISKEKPKKSRNAVTIKQASFSWSKSGNVILKDINLKVEKKSLVAVVGKVGMELFFDHPE